MDFQAAFLGCCVPEGQWFSCYRSITLILSVTITACPSHSVTLSWATICALRYGFFQICSFWGRTCKPYEEAWPTCVCLSRLLQSSCNISKELGKSLQWDRPPRGPSQLAEGRPREGQMCSVGGPDIQWEEPGLESGALSPWSLITWHLGLIEIPNEKI